MYRCTIEIELDDFAGFHAVILSAEDDSVLHVTDSFLSPEDAEFAARTWIDDHNRYPLPA